MNTAVVPPVTAPVRDPRPVGGDGIGVVRGKGVRLHTCPRCTRTLPPLPVAPAAGTRLCHVCAAERHLVVAGRRRRWFS